ncbi:MAG: tRNA (N6-threonylcarbamoyladenosine(37)-N6)-methyltransferase TrmO [Bdellovibrio sp.]
MLFEPIGHLESCYPDKFGTPRQPGLVEHSLARLKIHRKWQPEEALQGLDGFSHAWVIFVFHQNDNARYHAKVHPPRLQGESIGVFATRSPHRPNPLGLSLVKVVRVESDAVILAGVDMIDGTPVLDLKPYLPDVESQPHARGGWAATATQSKIEIEWSEALLGVLKTWSDQLKNQNEKSFAALTYDELRQLIEGTLALDPRPVIYRGFEGQTQTKYRNSHAVRFLNGDVHFEFLTDSRVKVLEVRLS